MSFMPGELVRRAAAGVTSTVSSTVSSVASVASGKRRHDSTGSSRHSFYEANLITNAKEKYTMTVKCTPSKDAATTADLSVKAGFLMKRNEQGTWQKRFMCIVPHMFLYYYDSELAEAPRGIIDLELYQHTEREEGGGISLVAADESLRCFHFNDEDDENLNEWATSLIRDRYHLVCEERNAYQQMQSLMTGAIDNASSAQKLSEQERAELERQLSEAENLYLEARRLLQTTLVDLGISDEEMSQLTDVPKIGSSLRNRIADMRNSYEHRIEEFQQMMNNQQTEYGKMTEEFLKKMDNEQLARKNLEALILKERKESEKKVKEAEAQIDNITLNFQMAVAAKTTSETKSNTLNEQKKLLVKEVKQLRKRVDELSASNDELKALNDRLLKAATALQYTVKSSAASSPKTIPNVEAGVLSPSSQPDGEIGTGSLDEGTPSAKSAITQSQELEELLSYTDQLIAKSEQFNPHDTRGRSFDSNTANTAEEGGHNNRTPPSSNPVYRAMNLFRTGGSDDLPEKSSERQHSDEKSRNNSIIGDDFEERPSWEMPPMALRELGWLSEEQNKLMEKRLGEVKDEGNSTHSSGSWTGVSPAAFKRTAQEDSHSHEEHRRGSTLGMFSGLLGSGSSTTETASSSSPHTSGRRSSLLAITSIFNKKEKDDTSSVASTSTATTTTSTAAPAAAASKANEDLFFSSPFTTPTEEEEGRLPTAMRLHCLRCNGTVEGPKFSTCKCSTPALTPEDLTGSSLSAFTGMFKGGILKATGLYGSTATTPNNNTTSGVVHNSNEISL